MRNLVWFSCGSASFACLWMFRNEPNLVVAYCDTGSEHQDNKRFLNEVVGELKVNIQVLKNEKYRDHFERMAKIEREVGHSCIKNKFLDELKEEDGRDVKSFEMSCDFVCQSMEV